MSIAVVALALLLIVGILYLQQRQAAGSAQEQADPPLEPNNSFEVPGGYLFHPGHTWVAELSRETARVGMDSFAANLLGKLDRIAVIGEQRWVRQGQKLMTLTRDSETLEMLSPLEGVVTAVNAEVTRNPELAFRDPYGEGWVCVIKSPEMEINRRNLMPGPMTASWLEHSLARLKSMLAQADPALAQDGGMPLPGALGKVSSELRRQMIKEFLLT